MLYSPPRERKPSEKKEPYPGLKCSRGIRCTGVADAIALSSFRKGQMMQSVAAPVMLRCLMLGVPDLAARTETQDRHTHTHTQSHTSASRCFPCEDWRSQIVSWLPEDVLFVFRAWRRPPPVRCLKGSAPRVRKDVHGRSSLQCSQKQYSSSIHQHFRM